MIYVIADGDEGVQLNDGVRLAFAGAGFKLEGFDEVAELLKKQFSSDLRIVSSAENAWVREKLDLGNWEQVDASTQQHTQALADKNKLQYAGFIPFADPTELDYGVRGHMVRPKNMHLANKISFTIGGGEAVYNLGHFLISADWVGDADEKLVRQVLEPQIAHYTKLAKQDKLEFEIEDAGRLSDEVRDRNREMLKEIGIVD